jgi:hypothetical protein
MRNKHSIKHIFLDNNNWTRFLKLFSHRIRNDIIVTIDKFLKCGETIIGYNHYKCSNSNCNFTKKIAFTCKCKACASCGRKSIEVWMVDNTNMLPNTSWQHITFSIPDVLWEFFWCNRHLFKPFIKLAAECIQEIAMQHKVVPAIFIALHTFKRNLKRNVHIHLSTTTGGLSLDLNKWKKLYFYHQTLKKVWKYKVITLFRSMYKAGNLLIPNLRKQQLKDLPAFNRFLNEVYQKTWVVHCAKPSKHYKRNLEYFSRYTKRPPIAESKITHYDGEYVTFTFKDHNTQTYQNETITVFEFIRRFIQHIPDIGFRMIRYYGLMANRIRTNALKILAKLLGSVKEHILLKADYADLLYRSFGIDPLICPNCGNDLILFHTEIISHHKSSIVKFS